MACRETLIKWMEDNGLTQMGVAKRVGVSRQAVARWIRGESVPFGKNLDSLSAAMGIPAGELMYGRYESVSPVLAPSEEGDSKFITIKEYIMTASAGAGSEHGWEELNESVPAYYREDFFVKHGLKPERCRRIKVVGDSMSPTLSDGDTILFEDREPVTLDMIRDGAIYVLSTDTGLKVKRLSVSKSGLIIRSDNPNYPDETYSREEQSVIRIYGRVFEVSRIL